MTFKLEELRIRKEKYGDYKGKYSGVIKLKEQTGNYNDNEIECYISPEKVEKILLASVDVIMEISNSELENLRYKLTKQFENDT